MRKDKISTRKLLNLKNIGEYSLDGYNNHHLIFYSITPFNLSVLSEENISSKIFSLMNIIKSTDNLEFVCLNGRENFNMNKLHIKQRLSMENNTAIKQLLELDLHHIDEIQVKTATARTFLIILRIKQELNSDIFTYLNRFEKSIKSQGFSINRLSKSDIKTLLAVYYEQNVTTELFEDIDGRRWLNDETKDINT